MTRRVKSIFYQISKPGYPTSAILGTCHLPNVDGGNFLPCESEHFKAAKQIVFELDPRDLMLDDSIIEAKIALEGRKEKKEIHSLESMEDHFAMLQKVISFSSFSSSSSQARDNERYFSSICTEYLSQHHHDMSYVSPELYKLMFTDRNYAWMEKLEKLLETKSFIVVGTSHLYEDDGLISLFRKNGFTVTELELPRRTLVHEENFDKALAEIKTFSLNQRTLSKRKRACQTVDKERDSKLQALITQPEPIAYRTRKRRKLS